MPVTTRDCYIFSVEFGNSYKLSFVTVMLGGGIQMIFL